MPQANSTTSSPRWTSPRASLSTLPCSSVIASAIRPTLAFTSSRKAKSTLVRWLRDASDHVAERLARRPYDGVHVVAAGQRDLGLLLARRRVPDAAAAGAVPARGLAADPVVDGPHRSSLSFGGGAQVAALPRLLVLVRGPSIPRRLQGRDLGHRHVPPGGAVGRRDQRVGLHVDHGGDVGGLGVGEGLLELGDAADRRSRARRGWRRWPPGRPGGRRRRARSACGSGSGCRSAATRATPTGRRWRRSRGSAPAPRSASRPPARR